MSDTEHDTPVGVERQPSARSDEDRELAERLEGAGQEQGSEDVGGGFSFSRTLSPVSLGLDNPVAPAIDNDKTVIIGASFEGGGSFPGACGTREVQITRPPVDGGRPGRPHTMAPPGASPASTPARCG